MLKNISVIFYEPKICEDDRHSNTIKQNVWKRQLTTYIPHSNIPMPSR
jgi:DNA polymerase IIIc chi subunit